MAGTSRSARARSTSWPVTATTASTCFRHDRVTGETVRVSVATGGGQGSGDSVVPRISNDGNLIAFRSNVFDEVNGKVVVAPNPSEVERESQYGCQLPPVCRSGGSGLCMFSRSGTIAAGKCTSASMCWRSGWPGASWI